MIDAGVSTPGSRLLLELARAGTRCYCDDRRLRWTSAFAVSAAVRGAHAMPNCSSIATEAVERAVTADGTVSFLDFSIAKMIETRWSRLTREAGSAMTPKYAAPEQVKAGPITTATMCTRSRAALRVASGRHPPAPKAKCCELERAIADVERRGLSGGGVASANEPRRCGARLTTPERRNGIAGDPTPSRKALRRSADGTGDRDCRRPQTAHQSQRSARAPT